MSEDGACAVSANFKTTTTTTKKACRFWAPVYDHIYGLFLKRAQAELALRVADAGSDILDIGVGTGLVLPLYSPGSSVTGIDISEEMLVKAKAKIAEGTLPHVTALHVMDACDMAFPDASFDVVSLPFVIPLIPDTDRLLSECARVLRSRGEIIIVSKITTSEGAMRRVEQLVSPLVQNIGLSSAFRLVENRPISPAGHFRLLQLPARERLQGGAALYACVRQPSCRWAIPSCEGQQHGQGKWPTML